MTNELKTWADLAKIYDLVLFNNCIKLEDGRVYEEYIENIERDEDEEDIDEVYQWYAMEVSEFDVEYLNKEFDLNIFYSDTLDLYILPVYHFGTGWDMLNLKGGYSTD